MYLNEILNRQTGVHKFETKSQLEKNHMREKLKIFVKPIKYLIISEDFSSLASLRVSEAMQLFRPFHSQGGKTEIWGWPCHMS